MRFKLKTFVLASSVAAFSLGILALTGWISGLRVLAGGFYGYSLMSPNSALVFITMGLSCLLLAIRPDRYLFRDLARMTSVLSMLVGTVNLAEVFLRHKHISHHWLSQAIRHPSITDSGSISPVTAGAFILAGCALYLYIKSRKASCGILGSATIATGWVIFTGYLFGLPILYGGTIDPVSLTTSLAIISLGMALTGLAGTDVWPLKDLTGSSTAAMILRPLLPTIILLILIQNWLFVNIFGEANSLDILQSALATILTVVATYVAVLLMSKHVALKIDRAEIARRKAENNLHLARQHILAHIDNSPLAVI
jgi:hypothetical protein